MCFIDRLVSAVSHFKMDGFTVHLVRSRTLTLKITEGLRPSYPWKGVVFFWKNVPNQNGGVKVGWVILRVLQKVETTIWGQDQGVLRNRLAEKNATERDLGSRIVSAKKH